MKDISQAILDIFLQPGLPICIDVFRELEFCKAAISRFIPIEFKLIAKYMVPVRIYSWICRIISDTEHELGV